MHGIEQEEFQQLRHFGVTWLQHFAFPREKNFGKMILVKQEGQIVLRLSLKGSTRQLHTMKALCLGYERTLLRQRTAAGRAHLSNKLEQAERPKTLVARQQLQESQKKQPPAITGSMKLYERTLRGLRNDRLTRDALSLSGLRPWSYLSHVNSPRVMQL